MKLDNAKRATKVRLLFMVVPMFLIISTAIIYLMGEVRNPGWLIGAGVLLFLFFLLLGIFKFNYISFYVGTDKILLKFKSLTPIMSTNQSIQIRSEYFHHYEVSSKLAGLKKTLYLFQDSAGAVAKYQGVGVNLLSDDELGKITKALDLVIAIRKGKK